MFRRIYFQVMLKYSCHCISGISLSPTDVIHKISCKEDSLLLSSILNNKPITSLLSTEDSLLHSPFLIDSSVFSLHLRIPTTHFTSHTFTPSNPTRCIHPLPLYHHHHRPNLKFSNESTHHDVHPPPNRLLLQPHRPPRYKPQPLPLPHQHPLPPRSHRDLPQRRRLRRLFGALLGADRAVHRAGGKEEPGGRGSGDRSGIG